MGAYTNYILSEEGRMIRFIDTVLGWPENRKVGFAILPLHEVREVQNTKRMSDRGCLPSQLCITILAKNAKNFKNL